jgi:hypothetical protein
MRKLICGVTGLALVAAGYAVARYVPARTIAQQVHQGCGCAADSVDAVEEDSDSCSARENYAALDGCKHCPGDAAGRSSDEESAPLAQRGCLVPKTWSASIFIPDVDEPPAPLADGEAQPIEDTQAAFAPRLMPYCNDAADVPTTMPYADDDPWPVKSVGAVQQAGWFEDSEPTDPDPMPACREDENLSRQYPGCPFPGGHQPSKVGSKKAAPWQHDREPILPVAPEFQGTGVTPLWLDGAKPGVPAQEVLENGEGWFSQTSRTPLGLQRHTTLKVLRNWNRDTPARQPVDTLELRPGDLRPEQTVPELFE